MGCFSFYPVKHITTAEGGMFVTTDEKTSQLAGQKRAFGVDRTHSERKVPGVYDVNMLGLNSRMSEMQAALGRVQMDRVPEILKRRQDNFDRLSNELNGSRVSASSLPRMKELRAAITVSAWSWRTAWPGREPRSSSG